MRWTPQQGGFDEIFDASGSPRPHYAQIVSALDAIGEDEIKRREQLQQLSLLNQGITFAVYGDSGGAERVLPFDLVPRIVPNEEWLSLEAGLIQRVTALNLLLADLYTDQKCLKDGVLPYELILSRAEYNRELRGMLPQKQIYTHIVGTDLVRDAEGRYLVLEDNCRVPSGVSYVLENRNLLKRSFPELFAQYAVQPIEGYPSMLLDTLRNAAPRWGSNPRCVVLSPGMFNSAYFEHSFLAREMGIPLVEGRDLAVENNHVFVRTTEGNQQVDVIYRRIDDDFLDPLTFRRDSQLGVPGLINAYREGNIAIANAPGCGIADNKAVYAFVPEIIRYYLGEDPKLGQVPTYVGLRSDDFKYMCEHLDELVVKTTGDAGGYGMLVGPCASQGERGAYLEKMKTNPCNYVAQPLIELSSHATYLDREFRPRRVDLRPFILYGERIRVLPGGLTRVALVEGSYVVNSSQGGGSKDTWVLGERSS